MRAHCCERETRTAGGGPRSGLRRGVGALGWAGPGAALVLMPKCPMCVAGYLALAGVGVSLGVAAEVRLVVLGVCLAVLGWLGVRVLFRRSLG